MKWFMVCVLLLCAGAVFADGEIGNPAAYIVDDATLPGERGSAWEVGYADGSWMLTASRGILVVKRLSGECLIERVSPRVVTVNSDGGCNTRVKVISPRKRWQVEIKQGNEA